MHPTTYPIGLLDTDAWKVTDRGRGGVHVSEKGPQMSVKTGPKWYRNGPGRSNADRDMSWEGRRVMLKLILEVPAPVWSL